MKMLQHHGVSLHEQAAHCSGYCHGTQTTDSNRVRDCLLSVRPAVMATHAWTKLGQMHGLSKS